MLEKNGTRNKSTQLAALAMTIALLGSSLLGCSTAPDSKAESVPGTENSAEAYTEENVTAGTTAVAAESSKSYEQIIDIMDNSRHLVEEHFCSSDGTLVPCEDGYAIMRKEYDSLGNATLTSYFDSADKPILVERLGYASVAMTYDETGNKTGETYYDTDGNVLSIEGKDYAGVHYTYDENKNIASEEFFDVEGKPILTSEGFHKGVYTWDENKHRMTERYYDLDDKLVVTLRGYAGVDHEYDDNDNDIKCTYYDASENIAENTAGTTIVKKTYNENKQVVKEEYRNADNKREIQPKLGYCIVEKEYDEAGNNTYQTFYDVDKALLPMADGYTAVRREFDDNKFIVKESYFAPDESAKDEDESAKDEDDKENQQADEHSEVPYTLSKGYASLTRAYDQAGNVALETYFDADGKETACVDGYSRWNRTYDENRKVTSEAFEDASGKPVLKESVGYAKVEYTYDANGNKLTESYFGTDGNPVAGIKGYAGVQYTYNDTNQCVKEVYVDKDGNPAAPESLGYAGIAREYDANGLVKSSTNLDAQGAPVMAGGAARKEFEYDDAGNCTVTRKYDTADKLIIDADGVAWTKIEYDSSKRPVKETFIGENGEPLFVESKGYTITTKEYDKTTDSANILGQAYFDADDNPVLLPAGYAAVRTEYNEENRPFLVDYLDRDGNPVKPQDMKSGYSSIAYEYDDRGNVACEFYFDEDGDPLAVPAGYQSLRKEYNDQNKVTKTEYLDAEGKRVALSNGTSAVLNEYDENGNAIRETYEDVNGKAYTIENPNKEDADKWYSYAEVRKAYNDQNKMIEQAYYDADGAPAKCAQQFSYQQFEYDEQGRQIRTAWYAIDDQPFVNAQGYASMTSTYAPDGTRTDTYFDAAGNEVKLAQ